VTPDRASSNNSLLALLEMDKMTLSSAGRAAQSRTEQWMRYLGFPGGLLVFLLFLYLPLGPGIRASSPWAWPSARRTSSCRSRWLTCASAARTRRRTSASALTSSGAGGGSPRRRSPRTGSSRRSRRRRVVPSLRIKLRATVTSHASGVSGSAPRRCRRTNASWARSAARSPSPVRRCRSRTSRGCWPSNNATNAS